MKIEINIGNQQLTFLIAFIFILAVFGMAGAYNVDPSKGSPEVMGHSLGELDLGPVKIDPSGKVGINTQQPQAALDVMGDVIISNDVSIGENVVATGSVCDESGCIGGIEDLTREEIIQEAVRRATAPPTPSYCEAGKAVKLDEVGSDASCKHDIDIPGECKDNNYCNLYIVENERVAVKQSRVAEARGFNYRSSDSTWFAFGRGRYKDGSTTNEIIPNFLYDDKSGVYTVGKISLCDRTSDSVFTELYYCPVKEPITCQGVIDTVKDGVAYKTPSIYGETVNVPDICKNGNRCFLSFEAYSNAGFYTNMDYGYYRQETDNSWSISGSENKAGKINGNSYFDSIFKWGSYYYIWLYDDSPNSRGDPSDWVFRDGYTDKGIKLVACVPPAD